MLGLLVVAGASPAQLSSLRMDSATAPARQAIPDPTALRSGWWDFVAPSEPGLDERIRTLLGVAGEATSRLRPDEAGPARQALQRLRVSLTALPAMLAARPALPAPAPSPAEHYTTRQVLQFDRDVRDLQIDLDEDRSAMAVSARALEDGQRQLDAAFAAYLAQPRDEPGHVVSGLEVMAQRAEIAVTAAEQALRSGETEALTKRIAEMTALRDLSLTRIVPDPQRTEAQIRALVLKDQRNLESQREQILRVRAERNNLAGQQDAGRSAMELAELRIMAAMIEEALLRLRIDLYGTELDWLRISAGGMDMRAIATIEQRLAERRQSVRETDEEIGEWAAAVQRVIINGLRAPARDQADSEAGTRGELLDLAQNTITRLIELRSALADVRFGTSAAAGLLQRTSGWRGLVRARILDPVVGGVSRTDDWLRASLFRIGDTPVTPYGLLRVVLFLVLAVLLSRLIRHLLARFGARQSGRRSAGLYTLGRVLHYVLVAAAVIIGLTSVGIDFSQLALLAGALSIGIGFGLQSIVNNFVSGLMILFEQTLKIGDVVELSSGVRGIVREINVRSTLISTNDGIDIVVPNSEFISSKVTNYTLREPYHRIHVPFGVAYGTDKEEVRRVVSECARGVPFTHIAPGREPDVWLVKFGDSSLDFELVVWINPSAATRPGAVKAAYLWEIETTLKRNGIEIPFPQRDVHLRGSGA